MTTALDSALAALDAALAHANAIALGADDPVERPVGVRRIVDWLSTSRVAEGGTFAVSMYEAQRAVCSCRESFSQPADLRRHRTEHPDHELVENGATYAELTERIGVNNARVQQLIAKGRTLVDAGA